MAGSVRRPSLVELKPDARGARILAKVGYAALGDNNLLSALAKVLEGEGPIFLEFRKFIDHYASGEYI